ncbi:MAG: homocysteine S-methyltransferase family protein [Gammaproteobacteria bacterium]|nr:homocysteine S-methyltransferase family protein [Gammaproteobacteria bacterium]MDH4254353.1 homocysteine S-methyltransferase family protein [Gammaproteobacteria bacterium]MDH5309370.1 homocysteine S-methyltransferase family protein [Gammaproteobacteria bacterium]
MSLYRHRLPQLSGDLFLADAGIETDLMFNHGIEIREFAAHTLLPDESGRQAMADYFRAFLSLARDAGAGFILDSQTWKAHPHWARSLGATVEELRDANRESIDFIAGLRREFASNARPIVLAGIIGPRGDAYAPELAVAAREAERYHATQVGWLAETDADFIAGVTFTQSDEAIGLVRAARAAGMPVVISFTVETDGCLPSGQALGEAIRAVDDATDAAAAYFGVNCAHPDHFFHVLEDADWARRLRSLRCNASRRSHAELDRSDTLDAGNPRELGRQYADILDRLPWVNVVGGCCGTDLRHVTAIARAARARS